jgi:hypothetical protein
MQIVTLKPPNEDKDMITARQAALNLGHRMHPAWLMGLLTVLVLLTLDIGVLSPLRWSLTRIYEITGILLSDQIWRVGLGLSAFLIAYFRPNPRWTLIYSFPLLTYIGMVTWYGMSANRLATPIVVLIFFAFIGVLFIQLQAEWILSLLRQQIALEERIAALSPGEADEPAP